MLTSESEIEVSAELASLKAACKVCDIILLAKKQVLPLLPAGESLKKAIKDWFQKHKLAYGRNHFKPKHHWMFDVAEQLIIDNEWQVFDQLIIERLHLLVKNHADRIDNPNMFRAISSQWRYEYAAGFFAATEGSMLHLKTPAA